MKKTVSISTALLPPAVRERFEAMLPIAARRSIVQWQLTSLSEADVLLSERPPVAADRQVTIHVTDEAPDSGRQALVVPREFRVGILMDVLDLAAVRVLDHRDSNVRAATQTPQAAHTQRMYQLKYWVVPGDRTAMRFLRTLAGMTRQPVSYAWMLSGGGLSSAEADALLIELELRGALRVTALPPQRPAAPPASTGFIARLRHWLRGGHAPGATMALAR